jgi:hypothetical protein
LSNILFFLSASSAVNVAKALASTCHSWRGTMRRTVGPSMHVKVDTWMEPDQLYIMLKKMTVLQIEHDALHIRNQHCNHCHWFREEDPKLPFQPPGLSTWKNRYRNKLAKLMRATLCRNCSNEWLPDGVPDDDVPRRVVGTILAFLPSSDKLGVARALAATCSKLREKISPFLEHSESIQKMPETCGYCPHVCYCSHFVLYSQLSMEALKAREALEGRDIREEPYWQGRLSTLGVAPPEYVKAFRSCWE